MAKELSYAEDVRMHYDPEKPHSRFVDKSPQLKKAVESGSTVPSQVPWPTGAAPKAAPIHPEPSESDSLAKHFKGYDAIVMTYTSAEAAALAALFTPGYPVSIWYEYRYDIEAYIPIVTGENAPFNDDSSYNKRYYHSLGLYFPCTIGKAKVLLVKSGLHLDYDTASPVKANTVIPFYKMLTQMLYDVEPKMFITTGTGGGIGSEVMLGDVVLSTHTRFDCTGQFKSEPWAKAIYATSSVPSRALEKITPQLTEVNGAKIAQAKPIAGRTVPKIWYSHESNIVTTDVFAFDTSGDYYHLQGLGKACDMGDAMVGQVMQQDQFKKIQWHAIRNASDPQIPNTPPQTIEAADKEAGDIYSTYGAFTTAVSVITTWAVIDAAFNS